MTLEPIVRKLEASERLTFEDAVALFRHPDVVAVGRLANRVRERLHGDRTYFNRNMRIEVTNVCVASCLFCSFAKLAEGAPGAHTMSLGEAWGELESRMDDPPAEIHIVNGLHPGLPFSYYEELLAGFKRIKPDVHMKCFTAVEIHFFATHYGMTHLQVLSRLRAAGLDSLPGGGAEIFHPDVRSRIAHDKATADQYLEVHRVAHGMGIRTNSTMLYTTSSSWCVSPCRGRLDALRGTGRPSLCRARCGYARRGGRSPRRRPAGYRGPRREGERGLAGASSRSGSQRSESRPP